MVPRGQIIEDSCSVAMQGQLYNIHSVLVHKHNGIHDTTLTSKTFPNGDLQGDPLRRSADNRTIDSNLKHIDLTHGLIQTGKDFPPIFEYNGYLPDFSNEWPKYTKNSSTCTRRSSFSAAAAADAVSGWLALLARALPAYATA